MLEDVQSWKNSKVFGDVPHIKTGATALHVAAAKGYIKVIGLLIQAGAPVNAQVNNYFEFYEYPFYLLLKVIDVYTFKKLPIFKKLNFTKKKL